MQGYFRPTKFLAPKSTFVLSESHFWPKFPLSCISISAQRIMVSNGSLKVGLYWIGNVFTSSSDVYSKPTYKKHRCFSLAWRRLKVWGGGV